MKADKCDEKMRVANLCKQNPKEYFGYINCQKQISRKIGDLEDSEGKLHIISDEKIAIMLNGLFLSSYRQK